MLKFAFLLVCYSLSTQAFFFPPSASSCSCPQPQCPAAPTAHCIWKREQQAQPASEGGGLERIDKKEGTDDTGNDGAESNDDSMEMIYDDDEKGNTTSLATASSTKRETLLSSATLAPVLQTNGTQKVVNLNRNGGGKKEPLKLKEPASELKPQKQNVPMLAVVGRSSNNNSSDGNSIAKRRNCNSEAMHRLILENMDLKPSVAKRQIQSKVAAELNGRIDVICARKAFSYIVNSELFCEVEKDGTICLCYRQQS